MIKYLHLTLILAFSVNSALADRKIIHQFDRIQLTDVFFSEGANCGDFNADGKMDIVSGPYWYAGPDFKQRFEYYPVKPFDKNGYSDNFFAFSGDLNSDNWDDIIIAGFPGKEAFWYENPKGKEGHWKRHILFPSVDNESPTFTDIVGDEKPELVFNTAEKLGYATPVEGDPTAPWEFHAISPKGPYQRFTHGLGVGDVNNDGRKDLLEKNGWWEQPADLSNDPVWKFHEVKFSGPGGSQMYAYDFDGDGDNDVVSSNAAHSYGLSWFENKTSDDGKIEFTEHKFMGEKPEENKYGVAFSQLHALEVADIDGDGIKDIITGKRYWAHNGHDPGAKEPPVNYWFKTVRTNGTAEFIPYQINHESGVGTQVVVADVTGDSLLDLVVGNKSGTYVLVHNRDEVPEEVWKQKQPKPLKEEEEKTSDADEILPQSPDGNVLNLDFEKGSLENWIATGNAFERQPIEGDTVFKRRPDSKSQHKGKFWIGTFEVAGDEPQGTLTSATIKVTHPHASYLIGGGHYHTTRVEILLKSNGQRIHQEFGRNSENMLPVYVDLSDYVGKEIFIKLVDRRSEGWGHINFDHFRFHKSKPDTSQFTIVNNRKMYNGLPPEKAMEVMTLPEGFKASLVAAEPDIKQPIAMTLDDKGRIWVAEAYSYPQRLPEGEGKDRILILEDKDADGDFETKKVFKDNLNLVSGLEVGFGGVWVGQAPYFMFIPDKNGDDIPDSEPEILLDGWHYEDTHETLNSFIWGPDGWLYGCHGVFTHSRVGKPGTPDEERIPLNAGIWRYHPTRHEFEVFAHGTSNPWGVDFNDKGQCFLTCCVIPHLFHMIQDVRYRRQAGNHFNQYTYDDVKTIAKHRHWVGNQWNNADRTLSDESGGGHAHSGAMIYLADDWPAEYRNKLFMNNIHGARLNVDNLTRSGSGYVGDHSPDFLLANDISSQILYFRYGPDGQMYAIDWYDTNQCHHGQFEKHDRSNGRVFKVSYKNAKPVKLNLQELSSEELVKLQLHRNDWYVRHARRILQERGVNPRVHELLDEIAFNNSDPDRRLRGLWALHVTDGLTEEKIRKALNDKEEFVRGWIIQLAVEKSIASDLVISELKKLAASDPSQVVRLYITSALHRIPEEDRWNILSALVKHSEDASDHNLPLAYWYVLEPLVPNDRERAIELASASAIPLLKDYVLRRIAEDGSEETISFLVSLLGKQSDDDSRLTFLKTIKESLRGRRSFPQPVSWKNVNKKLNQDGNEDVKNQALALSVVFGDPDALAKMRTILQDKNLFVGNRLQALSALQGAKDPDLAKVLQSLLEEKSLRKEAITGLASYNDSKTPGILISQYKDYSPEEKRLVLSTLSSRLEYALALLKSVDQDEIPSKDLNAIVIRQLGNLKNEEVTSLVGKVWGIVRESEADKKEAIENYRKLITSRGPKPDIHLGRAVFTKTCAQCHKMYGQGGNIGPELTGSNRKNLDYLLSNVVDPSAVMSKDYQPSAIALEDGRVLIGLVKSENANALTVQTAEELITLPKAEIDEIQVSSKSMMPDNQWQKLSPLEIRSLVSYMGSDHQVSLLADEENVKSFFNQQNLNGWTGNTSLWRVEDGEIVGKSPGIKKNEFLISDLLVKDFELTFSVKLTPNSGNSGVQFRSQPIEDGLVRGYQADIGQGWWGKLYEEHGRAVLWDKSAEQFVKENEWNDYRIVAIGDHVQTYLNGNLCVDLEDPQGAREGIIALQVHAGPAMEIRFKNLNLKVIKK